MRPATVGPAIFLAMAMVGSAGADDEIDRLVREEKPPARFAEYQPKFELRGQRFRPRWFWKKIDGRPVLVEHAATHPVLYDHGLPIGYFDGDGGGFTLLTPLPGDDVRDRFDPDRMPFTYRIGVHTGFPTGLGVGEGAPAEAKRQIKVVGDRVVSTTHQRWRGGGAAAPTGEVATRLIVRVDPVLGYVVEQELDWQADRAPGKDSEGREPWMSWGCLFPRNIQNSWPDEFHYGMTVYTPTEDGRHAGGERFATLYNSGAMIETIRHGGHYSVRPDGLYGYIVDRNGWGYAETTPVVAHPIHCKTCPAYGEIFNHGRFPAVADADGVYRLKLRRRAVGVPPEIVRAMVRRSKLRTAGGRQAVQIRLGMLEDFEEQPLPYATPWRGIKYEPRAGRFEISTERAFSGVRSLRVQGVGEEAIRPWKVGLEHPPARFKPLEKRFRLTCRVYVEGGDTRASVTVAMQADYVKPKPGSGQTPWVTADDEWQTVSEEFTASKHGGPVALGFMVVGPGRAYFDDFELVELDSAGKPVTSPAPVEYYRRMRSPDRKPAAATDRKPVVVDGRLYLYTAYPDARHLAPASDLYQVRGAPRTEYFRSRHTARLPTRGEGGRSRIFCNRRCRHVLRTTFNRLFMPILRSPRSGGYRQIRNNLSEVT